MSIFEVFDWADAEEVQFKHKLNAETTRVQAELEALDRAEEAAKLLVLNLTQHPATPEQVAEGVVDLPGYLRPGLGEALTFEELPSQEEISARASQIAELAVQNGLGPDDGEDPFPSAAMIGGAPWLMSALASELRLRGILPLFAFSTRRVEEVTQPDGTVRKVSSFSHAGFVPA